VRHTKMSNRKFASIFTPLAGAENPAQIRPESPPAHLSRSAKMGSAGFQAQKLSQGRNWAEKFSELTTHKIHATKSALLTETEEVNYALQNRNGHESWPKVSLLGECASQSSQLANS